MAALGLPPLSLYAHLPWCLRKCPYCDFNSHRAPAAPPFDAYVEALLADLGRDAALVGERTLRSIFLGGGTPSLFPPEAIARLLAGIRERLPVAEDAEITLEANPGTVERGRFRAYREAGVNRISLGVQSLDRAALAALGRIHGPEEAEAALAELAASGLRSWNVDLMYGLPGQDPEAALADLEAVLAHRPPHLSHYQLTLEPGTPFARRPPPLPDEDTVAAIEAACRERLAAVGLERYEVSAFARPGAASRHNLNYWHFGDYLGIGAGAHGKLSFPGQDRILRLVKQPHPGRYLETAAGEERLAERREVTRRERIFEFLLNALRLTEGFPLALFEERTGLARGALLERAEPLAGRGLLELEGERLRPSARGLEVLNELLAAFLD